jgi:DNA-directed RNA polymerase subunit K/omega
MADHATSSPPPVPGTHDGALSGFHLVAVVFQRAKQLQNGARPRLEAGEHKWTRLALLEVLADAVSWSVEEPSATSPPAPPKQETARGGSRERASVSHGVPGNLPP